MKNLSDDERYEIIMHHRPLLVKLIHNDIIRYYEMILLLFLGTNYQSSYTDNYIEALIKTRVQEFNK